MVCLLVFNYFFPSQQKGNATKGCSEDGGSMCLSYSDKALPVHLNNLVALFHPSILGCNPSRSDTLDKDAQLLQSKLTPSPKIAKPRPSDPRSSSTCRVSSLATFFSSSHSTAAEAGSTSRFFRSYSIGPHVSTSVTSLANDTLDFGLAGFTLVLFPSTTDPLVVLMATRSSEVVASQDPTDSPTRLLPREEACSLLEASLGFEADSSLPSISASLLIRSDFSPDMSR